MMINPDRNASLDVDEYNSSTTEKVALTINYVDMMAVRYDPRDGHIKNYMPHFLTVCAGMSWHHWINLPTDKPSGDP